MRSGQQAVATRNRREHYLEIQGDAMNQAPFPDGNPTLYKIPSLRIEAFNAFNDRNLGVPDGGVTDGTFGLITSSGQPRNLQIGARLAF